MFHFRKGRGAVNLGWLASMFVSPSTHTETHTLDTTAEEAHCLHRLESRRNPRCPVLLQCGEKLSVISKKKVHL